LKHLIIGGVRSGKSRYAECLASLSSKPVLYLATAEPIDAEMQARIAHHQAHRPSTWPTIEAPLKLEPILLNPNYQQHLILIDCMTLWLNNWLYYLSLEYKGLEAVVLSESEYVNNSFQQVKSDFLVALKNTQADVVLVSNEVGFSITPDNALARQFCDQQGWLNQAIAEQCEQVSAVMAGLPLLLKGKV